MKGKSIFKRLTAVLTALLIAISAVPGVSLVSAVDVDITEHVADTATHNGWKQVFLQDDLSTENAGGIWVDKSVFDTSADFDGRIVSLTDEDNFLVSLSAIASTKSITGYSYKPTDTVLVLDISGSMFQNIESMTQARNSKAAKLAEAANEAIKSLLANNNHNRVGVVLYSTSGTEFLPVGRYEASDGEYIRLRIDEDEEERDTNGWWPGGVETYYTYKAYLEVGDNLKVYDDNGTLRNVDIDAEQITGGTYIQRGLEWAGDYLTNTDTTIDGGSFQAGVTRLPIIVLMSDGAATYGTAEFTDVTKGSRGGSGGGDGNAALAFVNQLTAVYTMKRIEEYYGEKPLLYTLGVGVSNTQYAQAILNPEASDATDELWEAYDDLRTSGNNRSLSLEFGGSNSEQSLRKYVPATAGGFTISSADKVYVDRYFSANTAGDITAAFQNIVDYIIIQSKYYPTYVTTGDHHLDGDINFKDEIGRFMEVKEIKGVLLGNTLFSGEAVAKSMNEGDLGTVSSPTPLGDELSRAVQKRLGVNMATAQFLIDQAYNSNQLYYNERTGEYSNYIGWYADANRNYVGFWNGDENAAHPANAVYMNRSYGFLGVTGTGINESDMMYLSVQVYTNIETGHSAVLFKIPSALIPLIEYEVSLEGTSYEDAKNIEVTRKMAYPIRLVYEVGLRSDINELNVRDIVDPTGYPYVDAETGEYSFYTNRWVTDVHQHDEDHHPSAHTNTVVYYQPSIENERYYYNEDTLIYSDTNGTVYTGRTHPAQTNGTYYRAYYVFSTVGDGIERHYEEIFRNNEDTSRSTIHFAERNTEEGTWYIPRGYLHRTTGNFYVGKPDSDNHSGTYDFVRNPVVGHYDDTFYATAFLGNNGLLKMVPAQGIKITKTIEELEPGTNTEFDFTITSSDATEGGTYEVVRYDSTGAETEETITFANGIASIKVADGDEVYIVGLETGDTFTITEGEHDDYRLVSINGDEDAESAVITVEEFVISDADFVNTYIPKGLLIVTKEITHEFGSDYEIDGTLSFDINVSLDSDSAGDSFEAILEKADGSTDEISVSADEEGVISISLAHGESIAIIGINENTEYSVTEADYSDMGFTASITNGEGVISADSNSNVTVTNAYAPDNADTSVLNHVGTKAISGRDWLETDSFEFILEKFTGTAYEKLGASVTADYDDVTNEIAGFSFDLSGEVYDKPGEYQYRIREIAGEIGGMTYSGAEYVFTVTVTDESMTDGALEIANVSSASATVTKSNAGVWSIATPFTNTYKASGTAEVGLNVIKIIENADGSANTELPLAGYQFGVYSGNQQIDVLTTDENGLAAGARTYTSDAVGREYVYTIREINTGVPGIVYSTEEYEFTVTIVDNYDGTISADITGGIAVLAEGEAPSLSLSFTNVYKPTAIVLEGTKVLEGRDPEAGEFEFEVYEGETLVAEGTNDIHGRIIFDEIDYDTIGEHIYTIKEVPGDNDTIDYDDSVFTVKVNVTTAADGSLIAEIDSESDEVVFTNYYNLEPTTLGITGTKNLEGRDPDAGEFTFQIIDAQGDIAAYGANDEEGVITFEDIEYTEAGEYTYTVIEVAGDNDAIDYDDNVLTIVVNVVDNKDGTLTATLDETKSDEIVFTNYYNLGETGIVITGEKSLEGDRPMEAGEFKFEILDEQGAVVAKGTNDEFGVITFEEIRYAEAGDHVYTVVEVDMGDKEITYDPSELSITVNVTDDGYGNLTATLNTEESDAIVFTNIYTYIDDNDYVTLRATKDLHGRTLGAGEFSFELRDADGEVVQTASNDAYGEILFETITFDTEGTFVYTMNEIVGADKNIKYDESVYTATITVTAAADGKLTATTVITDADGNVVVPVFRNKYEKQQPINPIDENVTVTVRKQILDNTGDGYKLDGFVFTLTNVTTGVSQTAVSDEYGYATFNLNYHYNEVGNTYDYIVSEVNTGISGMEYDTAVYSFTVKVNFIPPIFKVAAHITQNGQNVSGPVAVFVNTYNGIEQIDPPEEDDDPIEPSCEEDEPF